MEKKSHGIIYALIVIAISIGVSVYGLYYLSHTIETTPSLSESSFTQWIPLMVVAVMVFGFACGLFGKNWAWYRKFNKFMHHRYVKTFGFIFLIAVVLVAIFWH